MRLPELGARERVEAALDVEPEVGRFDALHAEIRARVHERQGGVAVGHVVEAFERLIVPEDVAPAPRREDRREVSARPVERRGGATARLPGLAWPEVVGREGVCDCGLDHLRRDEPDGARLAALREPRDSPAQRGEDRGPVGQPSREPRRAAGARGEDRARDRCAVGDAERGDGRRPAEQLGERGDVQRDVSVQDHHGAGVREGGGELRVDANDDCGAVVVLAVEGGRVGRGAEQPLGGRDGGEPAPQEVEDARGGAEFCGARRVDACDGERAPPDRRRLRSGVGPDRARGGVEHGGRGPFDRGGFEQVGRDFVSECLDGVA